MLYFALCAQESKDAYMNEHWRGTSVGWAYYVLHPNLGAARADLWRYAVLWDTGGVYIDDVRDCSHSVG